jgi:hypothetical protein
VLRTAALSAEQTSSLIGLESQFQFWRSPRVGSVADIMAAPEKVHTLKAILQNLNIHFETMVDDVET